MELLSRFYNFVYEYSELNEIACNQIIGFEKRPETVLIANDNDAGDVIRF